MQIHILDHLLELRTRLIKSVAVISVIFVACFYFSSPAFQFLASPLLNKLPQGQSLIATHVTAPFLIPLKFSFILSLMIAMPFLLYQIWEFIVPGLYRQEKAWFKFLLLPSVLLFYLGIAFAYGVVLPLVFNFFLSIVPKGVNLLPDIGQYLDFCLRLLLAFGIAFQVPIITVIIVTCGIVSVDTLRKQRRVVIVLAFTLGMLLTPPDVLSQILLAVPLCFLFELGLVLAQLKR